MRRLGEGQPVYGVQSPALSSATAPFETVEEMTAHYITEIEQAWPEGPYCLAGYCLGAYVALEIARRLEEKGREVSLLAVINTDGAWRLVRSVRQSVAYHLRRLAPLSFGGKLAYAAGRLRYRLARIRDRWEEFRARSYEEAGRSLPADLRRHYVEAVNTKANRRFVPQPCRSKVVCFQGAADRVADPEPFWRTVARGGTERILVAGNSIDVLFEPNVRDLAARLRSCLDRVAVAPKR